MKKVVLCQIAVLALACASCSNKNKTYPVSGKVTYKGSPAAGATVFFHRHGGDSMNDQMIMGIVQEDGAFELVSGSAGKGVPPGAYDVLIEWRRASGQSKGRPQRGRGHTERPLRRPKTPPLARHGGSQSHQLAAV